MNLSGQEWELLLEKFNTENATFELISITNEKLQFYSHNKKFGKDFILISKLFGPIDKGNFLDLISFSYY